MQTWSNNLRVLMDKLPQHKVSTWNRTFCSYMILLWHASKNVFISPLIMWWLNYWPVWSAPLPWGSDCSGNVSQCRSTVNMHSFFKEFCVSRKETEKARLDNLKSISGKWRAIKKREWELDQHVKDRVICSH